MLIQDNRLAGGGGTDFRPTSFCSSVESLGQFGLDMGRGATGEFGRIVCRSVAGEGRSLYKRGERFVWPGGHAFGGWPGQRHRSTERNEGE